MEAPNKAQAEYRLGILLAIGTLVWSGTYSSLAKGLTPFLSPMTLLLASETLTALFILLTFGVVPLVKGFRSLPSRLIIIAACIGVLNSAIAPYLWFSGLTLTTAANASLLSSVEIIWGLALAMLLLGERINSMQVLGMIVVLVGIGVINFGTGAEALTIHKGDVLVILGAVTSGTGAVLFKKYLSHIMPELAILIRNFAGIAVVIMIGFAFSVPLTAEVAAFPLEKVLLLLAFAFFSRYLTLTFFYESLDRLPSTTFSLIQIGSPLAGVLFAALIVGEQIHSYHILGGIFILLGLFIEQMSAARIRSLSKVHPLRWVRALHLQRKDQAGLPLLPKHV
ncbi:MAG: DMT family transporter [Candidatus Peribacteraceae bacterium]